MQSNPENQQIDEIEILIRSRYPIIYIVSWEERRVEEDIIRVSRKREKKVFSWSITQGVNRLSVSNTKLVINDSTKDPLIALEHIQRSVEPAIYILKDFHHYISEPPVTRKLRDLFNSLKSSLKTIIILSPTLKIPIDLEKEIEVIDYKLPTTNELGKLLDKLVSSIINSKKSVSINLDGTAREKIIQAALGLTLSEAENVFAKSIVSKSRLSVDDVQIIHSEKKQIIRKSGLLEFYSSQENIGNVGGLKNLKLWLKKRDSSFTKKARDYGLPQPKGVLLLGVSGSGKSLVAKAISSLWQLPLIRLDIGSLFSGLVGSSEENMRKAIKTSESVAPCLLWLDEIDKGFGGSGNSSISDGGTTSRVLSTFLTWMQEKESPVFIIATANNISHLPPELLRKGRFDEIFFLDLPGIEERREIFAIHLQKRNRQSEKFDLKQLAAKTDGFSGAEIEQVIISAMYDSFEENRELKTGDIISSIDHTVPLSFSMKESVENIRGWAKDRARPA